MSVDTDSGFSPHSGPTGIRSLWRRTKRAIIDALRPTERTLRSVTFRGAHFVVFANEDVGWRIIAKRRYEDAELDALERLVKPEDTCLDIGANIGIYSVLLARMASRGRVLSYEPVSLNQHVLRLNLALNEIANVDVRPIVLSDAVGETTFAVSSDGAFSSLQPTGRKQGYSSVTCPMSSLDHEFAGLQQRIDFIKIDVEGAELLVLEGGRALLSDVRRRPRALLVEIAEANLRAFGCSSGDLIQCLQGHGYAPHTIGRWQLKRGWKPKGGSENVLFLHDAHTAEAF